MTRRRPPRRPGPLPEGQGPRGARLSAPSRAPAAQAKLSKSPASAAAAKPSLAKSAAPLLDCAICTKSHAQKYDDCPSLRLIQRKKARLPPTRCTKCLGLLDEASQCPKGAECHLVTTRSGVQYNFLCKEHKEVHFRICISCPPRKGKAEVISQRVARRQSGRETSYPCSGIKDPQPRSSMAFKATDVEIDNHLTPSQVWPPEASPLSTT